MEVLKKEYLPEDVAKRVHSYYSHEVMPKTMMLVGEGRYCVLEGGYREENARGLALRPDDVWIGGFARSGTHWIAELTWLVANKLNYEEAFRKPHDERVWYYDYGRSREFFEALPSPRFITTHFPLSLLPPGLLHTCKMVYIARDPRDVLVSCFHFFTTHEEVAFRGTLKDYCKLFVDGHALYGPFFNNIKEFWAERNNPNLLFIFYEDMKKDLAGTARRVAKFFDQQLSDDQLTRLCDHLQFSSMKQNTAINDCSYLGQNKNQMVRKGVSGGWRAEFDEEMTRDVDRWMQENLKDTDLRFPEV